MPQPSVLVTITPTLYQQLFTPTVQARLQEVARVQFNESERNWTSEELAQQIGSFDAVITGWGTPTFTEQVMAAARQLRVIAHSAGSIKKMLPPHVFDSETQVTHAALPDGAIFVNTARSHTVDNDALLIELQSGRIQAALDVFDQEPLPADSPFLQLENVILTPHTAGASHQARVIVEELERFFGGEPLRYAVTGEMLATMA